MKLDNVNCIGVIGNGMIGDSMTVLTTGHGYKTISVARNAAKIPEYKAVYKTYFQQMIDRELMPPEQHDICKKYLTYTLDYKDLADCDIIFECVLEDINLKHEIYAKIEEYCPKVKAICSVSSTDRKSVV